MDIADLNVSEHNQTFVLVQALAKLIFFLSYLKFLKTYGLFFAKSLWAKVNPVDKAGENLAGNAKLAEHCPSMVFLVLSIEKICRSLAIVHIDCKKTKALGSGLGIGLEQKQLPTLKMWHTLPHSNTGKTENRNEAVWGIV